MAGATRPRPQPPGLLAVVEWRKAETPVGPPMEMRLSEPGLVALARKAGFVARRAPSIELPFQYLTILVPPAG